MQDGMNIVDLFCGCGGFSLGAHEAGLPPRLAFDVDPLLTSSYAANFPRTRLLLRDLAEVDGKSIVRELDGPVDGLFGGPPCQAFSDIGHRQKDDPRRKLLGDFFRLVAETQPAFFVMENVRGLLYADARPALDDGLARLLGRYEILQPTILDAADFGAATRRPRVFVIGYDRLRCDKFTIDDLNSARIPPATVKSAIADLAGAESLGSVDGFDAWRIRARGRPSGYAAMMRSSDKSFTGHRATAHTTDVVKRFSRLKPGDIDPVGRHARLTWGGLCPTLRAGTGKERGSFQSVRPIHPEEHRVITVREAARLQGFPDSFRFHPTVWHSFRMIGNSVSPWVAKAIFSTISKRLELRRSLRVAAE
jgi:DNA (cytosine-5)-methyltransferase 1